MTKCMSNTVCLMSTTSFVMSTAFALFFTIIFTLVTKNNTVNMFFHTVYVTKKHPRHKKKKLRSTFEPMKRKLFASYLHFHAQQPRHTYLGTTAETPLRRHNNQGTTTKAQRPRRNGQDTRLWRTRLRIYLLLHHGGVVSSQ